VETAILIALIGMVGTLSAALIAGVVQVNKRVGPANGSGSLSVMLEHIMVTLREQNAVVSGHLEEDRRQFSNLNSRLDVLETYTHDFRHEWKGSEMAREGWKQVALDLASDRRDPPS
jgi:hypothetical protein